MPATPGRTAPSTFAAAGIKFLGVTRARSIHVLHTEQFCLVSRIMLPWSWQRVRDSLERIRQVTPESIVLDLTPGVRVGRTTMCTADDAAAHAIGLAEEAVMQGSFGVGGFLLDQAGNVIVESLNAVVRDGHVVDPTAHVERQLIDWLCGARHRGFSTSASELTI